jgi:hypothetical protein
MSDPIARAFLDQARSRLTKSVERIEHSLDQLKDEQVWWRPNESLNSIANLILHLCGNLRQWIISGVGGASDIRDRPQEFAERQRIPKRELLRRLKETAQEADKVLNNVNPTSLLERRRVQGFDESVLSAIWGSLTHFDGHTQEIVYITRLQLGSDYRFAWVPATPEQGAAGPGRA